ncbi:MAG TPA: hypothetical protein VIR27_16655 [Mycobacteriales bacterium]
MAMAGCSTGDPRPATNATPSPLPCHRDAEPGPQPEPVVSSTGAAPRTVLRYHPTAGTTARATVTRTVTQTGTSTRSPSTATTTVQVPYTVTVAAVCGQVFTSTAVYGEPRIQAAGAGAAAARERLGLLRDLVLREAHDARGRVVASARSAAGGTDAATQQDLDDLLGQLAQSAVVLPAQPVGVGARWSTRSSQAVSGFALTSTTSYTVGHLSADEVTLDLHLEVAAEPQARSARGSQVSLENYRGSGSGSLRVNLATALPSAGTITLVVDQQTSSRDTRTDSRVTQRVRLSGP